jgi:hypothetical protein
MSRRFKRNISIFTVVALALVGSGAYGYWYFLLRGPLAGQTWYDFGDVPLEGENATVEHVLRLFNRFDHPIIVNAVRPECGCLTTARQPEVMVQPGAPFDLPLSMVVRPGSRTVIIHVDLGDDGVQALRVKATGRPQTRLVMPEPRAVLAADGSATIEFAALTYGVEDEPLAPTIATHPTGLVAEFLEWKLGYRPKDPATMPTEWRGRLGVHWPGEVTEGLSGGDQGTIDVTLAPARTLTIAVRRVGT